MAEDASTEYPCRSYSAIGYVDGPVENGYGKGMKTAGPFCLFLAAVSLVLTVSAQAKEIARDQYLKHVPLGSPRLVQQTAASDALHLYGDRRDPGYRDANPADGIDDARHEILLALAVRFAPYLAQNTGDFPTNFDAYVRNRSSFPLNIDTWDISQIHAKLAESKGINFSALGKSECGTSPAEGALQDHPLPGAESVTEDCKLLDLLHYYSPWEPLKKDINDKVVRGRPDLVNVLFFDFPGEGPENWDAAYKAEYEKTPVDGRASFPHAYVHPFLVEIADGQGAVLGYELVLQYWFFYPTNDSGMNHEGDWEHLNVLISPRSMVEAPLSADAVERILTGGFPATEDAADPLVIKRLDFYFHHNVMTLDFASPNVYAPREQWKKDVKNRPRLRLQENELWDAIRYMAYRDHDEKVVNTHPFGYIGADNKGLDQALAAPGGKNRNPHGTFPFPGLYRDTGPGGTTDVVSVDIDAREYWEKLATGRATAGPEFERGSVVGLAEPGRLTVVPDWERIADLTRSDARVRMDWSWLVLPIRWGYPATASPFSGVLENFDTGNVAPVGPSFNAGWNAAGPAPGFDAYDPHMMPSVFPLGFQDSFRNDLGFLNLTVPVLINLPPLDFLTRIAAYPFKLALGLRDPVYYPKDGVPFRFVGISSGLSTQIFDDDYAALSVNPQQYDEFIARFITHLVENGFDTTTTLVGGEDFKTNSERPFLQIAFYIGGHFASENTVRNARSTFGFSADFNNIPSYRYSAEINYWEYAGSLRYSLTTTRFQPFVKAGYGWSWYRLENVTANGEAFDIAESDWIEPDSIWPNVLHLGLGFEFIPWKRTGKLPGGADVAFRVEYAWYTEHLGLDLSSIPLSKLELLFATLGDVPGADRVSRNDFVLGMTVSF